MPSFYYEDEWFANDAEWTGGEDTDDDIIEEDDSYYSDVEENNDNLDYYPIRQPTWRHVMVGGQSYMVSDHGRIRRENSLFEVTKGSEESGSPYRTYTFLSENGAPKTCYLHDIVWQAFNGPPPDGWEVRHTDEETARRKRYYSNSLSKLTIAPIRAMLRPHHIFT